MAYDLIRTLEDENHRKKQFSIANCRSKILETLFKNAQIALKTLCLLMHVRLSKNFECCLTGVTKVTCILF